MTYRRVFTGTFQGARDLGAEVEFFKETVVPAMRARGALTVEMVQTNDKMFLATATYPDQETADADPDGIQELRKSIIQAFNLDAMHPYGGITVVGF